MKVESLPLFPIDYVPSEHEMRIVDFFSSHRKAKIRPIARLDNDISRHERRIARLIDDDEFFSRSSSSKIDTQNFIICFSNRSGSNLLASVLASNKDVARAEEFFNFETVIHQSQRRAFRTLGHYVDFLRTTCASGASVFGTKLSWEQLYFLTKIKVIPCLIDRPRFIHIYRRNVLDQAISFSIAIQTKKWTSQHKTTQSESDVEYSEEQIVNIMKATYISRAMFHTYFEVFGIKPVEVAYEDLHEDPDGIGARVLEQLQFKSLRTCKVSPEKVELEIQRSLINQEFRESLLNKYHGIVRGCPVRLYSSDISGHEVK